MRSSDPRISDLDDRHSLLEEQLSLALEAAGLGYWDIDIKGGSRTWSPEFRRIVGVSADAEPGTQAFLNLVVPEDRSLLEHNVSSVYEINGATRHDAEVRIRRSSDGKERWVQIRGRVYRGDNGEPTRAIGTIADITEQRACQEAAVASRQRLELASGLAGIGIYHWNGKDDTARWENEEMYRIFGRDPALGPINKAEFLSSVIHADDIPAYLAMQSDPLARRDPARFTCRIRRPSGDVRWITISTARIEEPQTHSPLFVGVIIDITDQKTSEERQGELVAELHHRVKNVLATVHAIATFSFRDNNEMAVARTVFSQRLGALAKTHDVLVQKDWKQCQLEEVVVAVISPYREQQGRFQISGTAVRLTASAAVAFSMVLNELCTNALKYGALSTESGQVRIVWADAATAQGRTLTFRWVESGGPAVSPPTRHGFGTRLIESVLAREIKGRAVLKFDSAGLTCEIDGLLTE